MLRTFLVSAAILYAVGLAVYMANADDQLVRGTISFVYYISLIIPPACLIDVFRKMSQLLQVLRISPEVAVYACDDKGIGLNLLLMFFSGIVFLSVCILIDLHVFENILNQMCDKKGRFPTSLHVDSDVQAENEKVNQMTESEIANSNFVVKNLSKIYGNFLAVNQLCVSIDRGECFGLLGINGAGKTTTFKMLTGDDNVTAGDAFIRGVSLKTQTTKANKLIGYCPQFDALLDDLTGRETLMIFCLLRGIPRGEIEIVYSKLSSDLGLLRHLDKQVKMYSGGNKRKLSTALVSWIL